MKSKEHYIKNTPIKMENVQYGSWKFSACHLLFFHGKLLPIAGYHPVWLLTIYDVNRKHSWISPKFSNLINWQFRWKLALICVYSFLFTHSIKKSRGELSSCYDTNNVTVFQFIVTGHAHFWSCINRMHELISDIGVDDIGQFLWGGASFN